MLKDGKWFADFLKFLLSLVELCHQYPTKQRIFDGFRVTIDIIVPYDIFELEPSFLLEVDCQTLAPSKLVELYILLSLIRVGSPILRIILS